MMVSNSEILALLSRIHLFHGLSESQLSSLIDRFKIFQYDAGKTIYEINAPANYFYIIISGQVRIGMQGEQGVIQHSVLRADDYFGEDVLNAQGYRRSSAIAEKALVLLRINRQQLAGIQEEFPQITTSLKMIYQVYSMKFRIQPTWIKPVEAIYFLNHPHPFFLFVRSILPIPAVLITLAMMAYLSAFQIFNSSFVSIASIFLLLSGIGWAIWNIVDWSNDYYIITSQRVVSLDKVVLLYDSRQETPLTAIISITKQTSLFGRFFAFGDIAIRTYTGLLLLKHVVSPDQVIYLIEEQWMRAKRNLSQEDLEEMEKLLRTRISTEEKQEEKNAENGFSGNIQVENGWLTSALGVLFGMRNESNGMITYRTHWLILLKKISLPSLIFIILLSLSFFYVTGHLVFISKELFYPFQIACGLMVSFWWVYQFVDWRNDLYIITYDSVVDINRKPLGLEDKRTAPIKNIQSIEYKRTGLFGLLLNFGTVFIRVGDSQLTFDFVHNPSEVQRELFERYIAIINLDKDAQLNRERRRMADWMEAYHRIMLEQEEEPDDGLPGI